MRASLVALAVLAGCHTRPSTLHGVAPAAGVSIALYRSGETSYGVVDDRRFLDIDSDHVLLSNIDPGASLASLVIETDRPDVRIGPCTRQRLPQPEVAIEGGSDKVVPPPDGQPRREPVIKTTPRYVPVVECAAHGTKGRYLVRIVYASSALAYRVQHEITVTEPTKATLDSRFALQTPPWRTEADVVLFDGVPGGVEPPREIVRGTVTLDGGTSVLFTPTRAIASQLRYVFEGTRTGDTDDGSDLGVYVVWAALELPGVDLPSGLIRVHVAIGEDDRWTEVEAPSADGDTEAGPAAKHDDGPVRLRLWMEETLQGARERQVVVDDGMQSVERVVLAITNNGTTEREVIVEEHARAAKRRSIDRAWPTKPTTHGDTIRNTLQVKPGATTRVGYMLVYEN